MAYTTAQLVTAYTNANLGKAPDSATTLTLDAYATQSQTGGVTDAVALANTLKLVNATTAVAVETYQFFTGHAPSAAGLDYLVDSTTNTNDLNDAYYSKFAQENRFINFSINLATGAGEGAAAFAASYGSVSIAQTVATAYDKIIGNAVATAAGVDVAAAVAYLSRQANIDYLTAFVKANTGLTAAADIDLAVKAALIGEILSAATTSGLGGYAAATTALINDLVDGTLSTDNAAGVNILTAYPGTQASVTTALTTGVDTLALTSANDVINATNTTLTTLDSIDGGAGNDTLAIVDVAGALNLSSIAGLKVANVEAATIVSIGAVTADVSGFSGLTSVGVTSIGATSVTAAGTTAVTVTDATQAAGAIAVEGGSSVSVTATSAGTGTITVGGTTAPTGAVTVKATETGANTQGNIAVTGGTSIGVTQVATNAVVNTTAVLGAVTATGTSATTSVSVSQTASATAGASVVGVTAGAVTINDANGAHATKAGTIATVTVANAGAVTIADNSLATLNLSGTVGAVTVNSGAGYTTTALALNLGKGSTGAITGAQYKTINATTSGAATVANIVGSAATTLNVAGNSLLTLTSAAGLTAATTVNVSGTAGLTATLNGLTTLTKVDTTGTTGTTTVSIDATKVTYAGGAGADYVTLVGALPTASSVTLGGGDDRLLGTTVITASGSTVVDGGAGSDTVASALINAGNGSMFKNFEVLGLGANTLDAALLTGSTITSLELGAGGGNGTFSNVTTAQSLSVTGTAAAGTTTLTFSGVSGSADAYTIGFAGVGGSKISAPNTVDAKIVSIAGIEAVSINSGAASGFTTNTISLTDAAARTLTVTGAQATTISFTGAFGTAGAGGDGNGVSAINASAATGIVTLNTANLGVAEGGLTITTGSADDSVTVAALTKALTVSTGDGADTIVVNSAATINSGAGNDVITLGGASTVNAGAGDDTITTSAHASSITLGGGTDAVNVAASVGVTITIADATGTGDSLVFANGGTEVFNSTAANVGAAVTLANALDLAITAAGDTNAQIYWFVYGADTYIVEHLGASTNLDAGDIVVKLAGTTSSGLASASYAAGSNTLTFA
ncbi:S-layer protein RsaA [Caulobacter sp.]|uniref:S-layer protein RsaA n=1 Tax=Caulobacter sp. TaxID=78 RepID=UPI003D0DF787